MCNDILLPSKRDGVHPCLCAMVGWATQLRGAKEGERSIVRTMKTNMRCAEVVAIAYYVHTDVQGDPKFVGGGGSMQPHTNRHAYAGSVVEGIEG